MRASGAEIWLNKNIFYVSSNVEFEPANTEAGPL